MESSGHVAKMYCYGYINYTWVSVTAKYIFNEYRLTHVKSKKNWVCICIYLSLTNIKSRRKGRELQWTPSILDSQGTQK